MTKKIIGIDLGTTNSCVAFFENGAAHIIKNRSGDRTTPSIVAFDEKGGVQVGQVAKRQLLINPDRTVYSVKRLMGSETKINILGKTYRPEDISAYILMEMKKQASEFLGYEVKDAIITVPAYFTEVQRQATQDAGKIAGLNVLRLVNEPTAAALAYKLNDKSSSTVLVYDLGGGTFDVSILHIENGIFEVKATNGDRNLGGDDFDNILFNWAIENIKKDTGEDFSTLPEKKQRIRLEAERVKKDLSFSEIVNFEIPFLTSNYSFSRTMNRVMFESMTKNLIERTKKPTELALSDAKMSFNDIDDIILVGGSTRMPAVKKLLKNMFNKEPKISIDPDESVALGAAIQGSIVAGDNKSIVLMDITSLSLGIEENGELMSVIIPRNSTIPLKKEQYYTNAFDFQNSANVKVFQGERKLTIDNEFLGEFSIDLVPEKKGRQKITVVFDLDVNGILNVTAYDSKLNKPNKITITRKNLSKEEINEKIKQAEEFKEKDLLEERKVKLFNLLDSIRYKINELSADKFFSDEDKIKAKEIEQSISAWYKKDDFDMNNEKEIEKKLLKCSSELAAMENGINTRRNTEEMNENKIPKQDQESAEPMTGEYATDSYDTKEPSNNEGN